jgi:peptidyl-prolyl cis-trans isomerase-like 2
MQAVQELNIKPRFWKDLLTDKPFTRKDIIHLQVVPSTLR